GTFGGSGHQPAPGHLPRQVWNGASTKSAALPRLPPTERRLFASMSMTSMRSRPRPPPASSSLHRPSGSRYSGTWPWNGAPKRSRKAEVATKENGREGTDQVLAGQPLPRFPGGDHVGDGSGVPSRGRWARGAAAPFQADRGEG